LLQQLIPVLGTLPFLTLDMALLSLFILLNMRNVKTGASIQLFFMATKLIPLLLIIFGGLWFFHGTYFAPEHLSLAGIPAILPLVLYATVGFESAASLSASLENPEKNGPRAIIISYSIVIALACLYQALFYATLGNELSILTDFRQAFAAFFNYSCGQSTIGNALTTLSYLTIASSALGGCYGILFSNHWNLHTLALKRHILGWRFFEQRNEHGTPWLCVLVEGFFCALYLVLTGGKLVLLQQISGLGVVITYTISVLAFMQTKRTNPKVGTPWLVAGMGLINCMVLMIACTRGLLQDNKTSLVAFCLILTAGLIMFWMTYSRDHTRS
jgi:APA family basic amino acid/polyamine antiporter